ncbi:MAG: porin family protein [Saprospiraceae bacterium]
MNELRKYKYDHPVKRCTGRWFPAWFALLLFFPGLLTGQSSTEASRFSLGALAGLTLSQIDGDNLQGYDHFGLMGGISSTAHLADRFSLSVELMYSQRGSQSQKFRNPDYLDIPKKVHLEYAEVNVLFHLYDWLNPSESFYHMDAFGGVSLGRLIRSTIIDKSVLPENFNNVAREFDTNDISVLLGVGYYIGKHWGLGFRFSRSLGLLFDAESSQIMSNALRNWKEYHLGVYSFVTF